MTAVATASEGPGVLHTGGSWHPICAYDDLTPERGAAALVDSTQIALFRTFEGSVFAISNQDPFTGAYVLARGIVGSRGDAPTVASPLHKQVFDLATGLCFDDPAVNVGVFRTQVREGVVEVQIA